MKSYFISFSLILALVSCMPVDLGTSATRNLRVGEVTNQQGEYQSPDGKCKALLKINSTGGYKVLSINLPSKDNSHDGIIANDITGMAWIRGDELVYTVSPIYGRPGIFLFNCSSMNAKQILGPKTINKAYPDGADYFELHSISNGKIYFYYAPDVDHVDMNKFRTKEFLHHLNMSRTRSNRAK